MDVGTGIVVAIDGPAGSGKSTAARLLATAEGFTYLNTGAMYRAVRYLVSEGGIDPERHPDRVTEVAQKMHFEYAINANGEQRFLVAPSKGQPPEDVTPALFSAALTLQLKPVVNNAGVRRVLVDQMRSAALKVIEKGSPGVILEGRDIGTVVFPDAFIKFYLNASLDQRAQRRAEELRSKGEIIEEEGLKGQLEYRDQVDQSRTVGPLKRADDAIELDTSALSPEKVLEKLQKELNKRRSETGISS